MAEIQVTDEQGNVHIFPDGSTPEMMAKALNVKSPQPSLDLSNSQGQGLYQMAGPDGKAVPVPYGQVQQAAQQGYKFASDPEQFRFAKDNAADPHRTTQFSPAAGDPRASIAYQQQMEQNLPAPMQIAAGIAKGGATLGRPVADVIAKGIGMSPDEVTAQLQARGGLQTTAKAGTIGAAIVPAAVTAPLATAGALVGGTVAGGVGQIAGDMAGMKPENTQLLSDASGLAGGIGGGLGGAKLSSEYIPQIKAWLRPPTSPSIVPRVEMAARQLSANILPAGKDAPNFIKAAQSEVANVLDYAKRTGNPLNTQLEFSKAAQGYAQEVLALKNSIEEPIQNQLVRTTGTGFGSRMQEGPDLYSTVKEIDKRIVALNQQLDAPAANSDDARRALASKTELQNQVAGLRDILHKTLSDSTGGALSPEDIANLRQRAGASFELANDTNASVTARMQAAGRQDLGPIEFGKLPSRALEFARGGPVPIADRGFQTAIKNWPGQASPLPTVPQTVAPAAAAPVRPSLSQVSGITAEPNPLQARPIAPESARAQVSTMNRRLARREIAVEDSAAAKKAAEDAANKRLEDLLSLARNQQKNARR